MPLELVPQTVYIHAVKLLSYSFALCFAGGGGGIVSKGKCEHLQYPAYGPQNQKSIISTKISLLRTKPHEQETQI